MRFRSRVCLAGMALLVACKTNLKGGRIERGAGPESRALDGFPFVLTRPHFAITRDEKGIDALAVRWVPDMSHVYTLRLVPAFIADSKFTLELNANGSLKSVATSSTENVTPTLKVIGQLAASLIGLDSALAGPLKLEGGADIDTLMVSDYEERVVDDAKLTNPLLVRLSNLANDKLVWDEGWLAPVGRDPKTCGACDKPKAWHQDHWREAGEGELLELNRLLNKLLAKESPIQFVPWSQQERLWLATAGKLISCEQELVERVLSGIPRVLYLEGRTRSAVEARDKACDGLREQAQALGLPLESPAQGQVDAKYPCEEPALARLETAAKDRRKYLAESAARWRASVDLASVEALLAAIEELRALGRGLEEAEKEEARKEAEDECTKLWANIQRLTQVGGTWPPAPANPACDEPTLKPFRDAATKRRDELAAEAKSLKSLLGLEDELRRVAIEEIERQIEDLHRKDAKTGATTPDKGLQELERKWAVAVGAFEEWVQEQKLLALLNLDARPVTLPEDTQAEAVQDYERARLQLAAVRRAMTEKRSKFKKPMPAPLPSPKNVSVDELSFATLAPHVVPPTVAEVRRLLAEDPRSPTLLGAIQKAAEKGSRFVLIREKVVPEQKQ